MSLEALARGLRQAGGVLSPDVAKTLAAEDAELRAGNKQEALLRLRHTLEQEAQKASPQYQMQQEQLQNERLFRKAAAEAGGDITKIAAAAAQYGKQDLAVNIFNQQERRAAEAQQRADALEERRRQTDQQHEYRMGQLKTDAEREAERKRHNLVVESLTKESNAARAAQVDTSNRLKILELELKGDRAKADQLRDTDRKVTAFANELQQNKIPGLTASLTTANDILKKYEDKDDIPGVGAIEGSSKVPNLFRSEESNKVRGALQAVSNDLLNLYSGLAVTLPEAERRQLEEMRRGDFKEKDFRNAWPTIVKRYNTVMGNIRAGVNAEVLKEYQSRPGALKLDTITPAFEGKGGSSLEMDGYRFPNQEALDAYKKAKAK